MVRLRFAPSPTGYLHVGGLRTALYSYLYAKQQHGKFIFRLEDTDQKRLVEGAEENLIQTLAWAGVAPDEGPHCGGNHGPYRQSERLELYQKYAQQLLDGGHAYRCFCSSEVLEGMRKVQQSQGLVPKYDKRCRYLKTEEIQQKMDADTPHVVRMKIPEQNESVIMDDLIRGKVSIDTDQLDDQVIMKTDGFPTYHLAMVVDDHHMEISHVVRGEEWLPSYPKHILLFRYLGWEMPQFAHLSLILNQDRSKLSKRQGDVAVEDFRDQGYLKETLVNFIALLGWNTSDDQELFSMEELIEKFSFERVGKSGSVFDREKLKWMNEQYIKQLDPDKLYNTLKPYIDQTPYANAPLDELKKACIISQTNITLLPDIQKKLPLFFADKPELSDPKLIEYLKEETPQQVLQELKKAIEALDVLDSSEFKQLMKQTQKATGIKGPNLWHPVRYALTLEEQGPDLSSIVDVFGKKKCLTMIEQALSLGSPTEAYS